LWVQCDLRNSEYTVKNTVSFLKLKIFFIGSDELKITSMYLKIHKFETFEI